MLDSVLCPLDMFSLILSVDQIFDFAIALMIANGESGRSERNLGDRHYAYQDARGVAVPWRRGRPILPPGGGPVDKPGSRRSWYWARY